MKNFKIYVIPLIISVVLSFYYIENEKSILYGSLILQIQNNQTTNSCVYYFKDYVVKGEYKTGSTNGFLEGKAVRFGYDKDFSKIKHRFVPSQGPELYILTNVSLGVLINSFKCDNIEFEKNTKHKYNVLHERYIGGLKHLLKDHSGCLEYYSESYSSTLMLENKFFKVSNNDSGGSRPSLTFNENEHIYYGQSQTLRTPELKEFEYYKFFILYLLLVFSLCIFITKIFFKENKIFSLILPFSIIFGLGFCIFYIIETNSFNSNKSDVSGSTTNYSNNRSTTLYQENDESTESKDITDMSCSEILATVMDNGDLLDDLDDSDMNSSALDYIAIYEYDNTYYLVVEFTSSSKKYVYCDVNYSDWDDFVDNAAGSYGESFNDHLNYSNCNCD